MLGLARELDPCITPNYYYNVGGAWNSLGLLRPGFQLLYKKINYQYLTIFDQI